MKVRLVVLLTLIWSACSLKIPTTQNTNKQQQSTEFKQSEQIISKQNTGQCQNDYWPVAQGTYRKYEMKAENNDTITETITRVRDDGFDVRMDFGSGAILENSWECKNDGLIYLDKGKNITLSTKETQMFEGKVESMNGVTIPANLKPGQMWDQKVVYIGTNPSTDKKILGRSTISRSCKAVDFEQVQVPAGTFEALKVECSIKYELSFGLDERLKKLIPAMSFNSQDTQWMVAGVGVIKSVSKTDTHKTEMNLVSYNIP